jgi:ParB-like chromosome segregation protein Spo0J
MAISNTLEWLDPKSIIVTERQRSETKLDDGLLDSIRQHGILVPLLLRKQVCSICHAPKGPNWVYCITCDGTGEERQLVAGRRRLACAIELELEHVPVTYFESLIPTTFSKIIELEENIKRTDLPWRDLVRAVGEIHKLKKNEDASWSINKTAKLISYSKARTVEILMVFKELNSSTLANVTSFSKALSAIQRVAKKRNTNITEALLQIPSGHESNTQQLSPIQIDKLETLLRIPTTHEAQTEQFSPIQRIDKSTQPPQISTYTAAAPDIQAKPNQTTTGDFTKTELDHALSNFQYWYTLETPVLKLPVIVAEFESWISNYSGPKFNLIHCDFRQGDFWSLTDIFIAYLNRVLSHSAHVMFWFEFEHEHYPPVVEKLCSAGLWIRSRPLIWVRSDILPVSQGRTSPRANYETCLTAYKNRKLMKSNTDAYVSQKREPMLKYFLSMLIDNVTDVLDISCDANASVLCAADELDARSITGLTSSVETAASANANILRSRKLRTASKWSV